MVKSLLGQLQEFPEYLFALKSALAVLVAGFPLYLGLRYFVYRRRLAISFWTTLTFLGTFILFAGLAFLLSSPLSSFLPGGAITTYLFMTCLVASFGIVSLIDVFFIRYFLIQLKQIYISPPLRLVIKFSIFTISLLPILRFVLHFNPLALVAIPTIATAGIALALQDTLKTFIAGVGLGHIIRLGEWISFEGKEGRVVDINWARTVLENIEGQRVYIPNTLLQTGMLLNYTAGSPANRQLLKVGASYDVAPARVKKVLKECAETTTGVAASPAPNAILLDYGDSAVIYGLVYWIDDFSRRGLIQDDVLTRVWYAFNREHIQIPFPIRTLLVNRMTDGKKKEHEQVKRQLKHWNLSEAFDGEDLEELASATRGQQYAPGEVIVHKGSQGQSVFCIVSGEADVYLFPETKQVVATLGPRDTFGELSFLTGAVRSATVKAKTAVDVLEVNKSGLEKILVRRPEVSERLAALVHQRQEALAAATSKHKTASAPLQTVEPKDKLSRQIRDFFGLS